MNECLNDKCQGLIRISWIKMMQKKEREKNSKVFPCTHNTIGARKVACKRCGISCLKIVAFKW